LNEYVKFKGEGKPFSTKSISLYLQDKFKKITTPLCKVLKAEVFTNVRELVLIASDDETNDYVRLIKMVPKTLKFLDLTGFREL
jgi:hypothetical protein